MRIGAVSCRLVVALGVLLLADGGRAASGDATSPLSAATSSPDDIFASKGLIKSGSVLVTADEAAVHSAVNKIAGLHSRLDSEERAMGSVTEALGTVVHNILKIDEQLASLDAQSKAAKNSAQSDALIAPHNELLRQLMQKGAAIDQLRTREGKIEDFQAPYADAVTAAKVEADAASNKYAALAADSALKSAVDDYNRTATETLKLGPSAQFVSDVASINKRLYELALDMIPAPIDHGVPIVDVAINGNTQPMIWDSGASVVSLSDETATAMGLHATDADKTVVMTVANGRKVSAKLVVARAIRVGPFIARDVECVIDPPGDPRPPDLLGESFQCLFLARMDQNAQVLHLMPIDKSVDLAPDAKPAVIAAQKTQAGAPVVHIAQLPPVPDGEDVFVARGLTRLGSIYDLSQEADIHSAANGVNKWKSKVVFETLARANVNRSLDTALHEYDNLQARLTSLDAQLKAAKNNPNQYNELVDPYNETLDLAKRKWQLIQDNKAKAAQIDDSRPMYTDALVGAVRSANGISDQYAALAADPPLQRALATANASSEAPLKLGPTGQFTMDLAFLRKAATAVAADGIAVQLENGVPLVPVIIHGKTLPMLWDSGASEILLSTGTAAQFGVHATDSDQIVKTELADGRVYDCKMVTIAEVRVGPFIARDIRCIIWPPGTGNKDSLLGGDFQRHFLSRLDEQAGVLHLTPNDDSAVAAADARPPS
jgi:aspartyl protease family protein